MKTTTASCVAFLLFAASFSSLKAATVISGPTINPANEHIYYLLSSDTWTASESEAISLGGHLATINVLAENTWVFDTFFPQTTGPTRSLWIGLNDAASSGNFVWSSGEPVIYTNWYSGEPNNIGLEHYVNMVEEAAPGEWNNLQDFAQNGPGGSVQYGVAEVVPEPTPCATLVVGASLFLTAFRRRIQRRLSTAMESGRTNPK